MPATAAGAPASSRLTSKESPISPAPHNDPDLDSLIEEITVDAYNEDEQLMGFENAFDEANFPCPGTVVGEDVEVLTVTIANDRRDLIAACQRNGKRYQIALLDIDIDADAETSRLIAAYRHWSAGR
jgi:Calcium binding